MAFQSGYSGNPAGRPRGSGPRQRLFKSLVEPYREAIFNTAIQLALNGNEAMLRLFLERMLPAKILSQPLNIQGNTTSDSINNLLAYVASGEITADEARKIASILHKNTEIENQLTLIEKIKALENHLNDSLKKDISC